jgi:lipopolysaccharide/colanic/teichoic acid biosynthesis glycosyltransferase
MNLPDAIVSRDSIAVNRKSFYHRAGKRWFDAVSAFCGLVILSPLFFLVGVLIKLTSRGPVFFKQVRVGQFGKPFRIIKFRTMVAEIHAQPGPLLTVAGDPRITQIGKWLRKTKVDELPQLINVLLGEMSLVGPRPEIPKYTANYTEKQKTILLERPGITGLSANVYEEELLVGQSDQEGYYLSTVLPAKLRIDIEYCENIAFLSDLKLVFTTFFKIFARLTEYSNRLPNTSVNRASDS